MTDLASLTDKKLIKAYEHQCSSLFTAMRGDPYHVTAAKSQANWERLHEEVRRRSLLGQVCK
ncbi:hypothetical protein HLB42_21620 (plasmid) [Deinococcus sp. D7000]|nr:hypothetical protein HLB42_13895 [Deinococcus sp. D7000]QLG13541.1 hypothetical protein HLB42_21620 [Deinococcus sp. D7000]